MSSSMLVYCVGVATRPGLRPITKKSASAAPTLCTEYGPNLLLLLVLHIDPQPKPVSALSSQLTWRLLVLHIDPQPEPVYAL